MGKHKRGGYLFYTWTGDHAPKHVHVHENGKLICLWNLETWTLLKGKVNKRIRKALEELNHEGLL